MDLDIIIDCIREALPDLVEITVSPETQYQEIPGWNSMVSVCFQMGIEDRFNVEVPPDILGMDNTISELFPYVGW
jgi:acyl carrier protein